MAFNPLHMFRKRQKTLLAILTIGTMFLFVLGSGTKGDFFSGGWFGGRKSGETYLKNNTGGDFLMNGKRVSMSDLAQVRRERRIAYSYFIWAHQSASQKLQSELQSYQKTPPTDFEAMKRQEELRNKAMELFQKISAYGQIMQFAANGVDNLLDFMMWREQAKRLGVTYLSDADIEHIVNDMAGNNVDLSQALPRIRGSLGRENENLTSNEVFDALRDEFSVHEAKLALQGFDEFDLRDLFGIRQSSSPETPYERFEDFRKNRTSNFLGVITLPVKDFVTEVKQTPTEDQLNKLFEVYKDVEYSPSSPKPGFKEPRRISLEWVSGRADAPFYRDLAQNIVLSIVATSPTNPWPTVDLAAGLLKDYRQETSEIYASRFSLPPVTDANFGLAYSTYFCQPESVASVIGQMAQGQLFPGVVGYQACQVARGGNEAVQSESNKRLQIGCSLLLSSANPFTLTVPILWAGMTHEKQYLPLDVVSKHLLVEMEQKTAQKLLVANLAKLQKELESKRYKPKEAREWLTKTLPELGLTEHVIESKPLGQYEINADPQIQPFKEAYVRQSINKEEQAEKFAAMFFKQDPGEKSVPYTPKDWPYGILSAGSAEQAFLYWKTEEDKQPLAPSKLDQARSKVEEAWRFMEAQKLAEKEADTLRSEAQATGGDVQKLKDLAEKHHLPYTELSAVARLIPLAAALPNAGKSYKRYEFPPDALPHSDPQTQEQVLDKLVGLQKVGDTTVYADQPKDQFYAATVYMRLEQTVDDFYRVYRDSTKTAAIQDHLFETLNQQRRVETHKKLLKELRARAASVDDKGQYNVEDEQRDDFEKRMRSSRGE